jgi:hypothetical protein
LTKDSPRKLENPNSTRNLKKIDEGSQSTSASGCKYLTHPQAAIHLLHRHHGVVANQRGQAHLRQQVHQACLGQIAQSQCELLLRIQNI